MVFKCSWLLYSPETLYRSFFWSDTEVVQYLQATSGLLPNVEI